MKKYILLLIVATLLVACSNKIATEDKESSAVEQQEQIETNEQETVEKSEDEKDGGVEDDEDMNISIDKQFAFAKFTFYVDDMEFLEEDSKDFVKINFRWLNQAGSGEKQLMNLAILTVKQDEQELTDIDDSWNIENNHKSPIYFPNAENGEYKFSLTYEIDKDKSLDIVILSLTDGERETIAIND